MIKYDQSFHQIHILIKMAKPLLILLRMSKSNQPHIEKLWFVVLVVDDHTRMSIPDINGEYYFPAVTELEDVEYEEGPGDYDLPEYLLDDEDVSDTGDGIPSRDNNRMGG